MTFDARYADQVRLLLRVLPLVAQEKDFALKGGTAINLFVRDMPRLSVDIDLAYLPDHGRADALGRAREALTRIQGRIKTQLPGVSCLQHNRGDDDLKLVVRQGRVQVKVEVNPVVRGSLHTPEERDVSEAVEDEFGFASASVLAPPDLYGGKLCAALDRQHPRDLFDVHLLLENEGIDRPLFEGFLVYLMSHPRPMAELLAPRWKALDQVHADEFAGMSREAVSLETLQAVGDALLKALAAHLADADIEFLLSFKRGEPDWRRCRYQKPNRFLVCSGNFVISTRWLRRNGRRRWLVWRRCFVSCQPAPWSHNDSVPAPHEERTMIKRIWHGWTTHANADRYEALLKEEIFPGIEAKQVPGYRSIQLLRREHADEVEFITLMEFDSLDAIKAFVGEDVTVSYVPDKAREVLAHWDSHAQHYEVREQRRY